MNSDPQKVPVVKDMREMRDWVFEGHEALEGHAGLKPTTVVTTAQVKLNGSVNHFWFL